MKLIFSHKIKKKELGKHPDTHDMEVIIRSCKKDIYDPIHGDIPPSTQLIKVYATQMPDVIHFLPPRLKR